MPASFSVPLDVLKKLGNGDAATGLAALADTFGFYPLVGPSGAIPAETVREIGHGDPAAGRRVLHRLIARIRHNKKPASGIIIRTNRADVGISIDHDA